MPRGGPRFRIEREVPIPARHNEQKYSFPFEKMKPGDSFKLANKTVYKSAERRARRIQKTHGWKFTARRIVGNAFRIWRIK